MGLIVEGERKIGRYRVDFFLPELGYVVEYDGPRHTFSGSDKRRDQVLETLGIKKVIRVREINKNTLTWLGKELGIEETS